MLRDYNNRNTSLALNKRTIFMIKVYTSIIGTKAQDKSNLQLEPMKPTGLKISEIPEEGM